MMQQIKATAHFILRVFKKLIFINGLIFTLMVVLSLTDIPYLLYHHLGTSLISNTKETPDYIVLMGTGGMPGPQGLLRSNYTATLALKYPQSKIVIALPADSQELKTSDHQRIIDELVFRGISTNRILSEINGHNTHTQAFFIMKMIGQNNPSILIVTSPEHMYRCIKTFTKAGFSNVNGTPAFENPFDENLLLDQDEGETRTSPGSAQNLDLRYNMWSYMQYQIIVAREYAAISYYWLVGYI